MIEIIYEDQDLIVVVKPPGMPSQKDPTGDQDVYTITKNYLEAKGDQVTLGLVQRLDRPVGGLMVMSKSSRAHGHLTKMVTERRIDKYYKALVNGIANKQGHLEHYLQKVRGNRAVISNKKTGASKKATLDYECLGTSIKDGETHSLLQVKLHTGRHHQIRAQLAHVKLAIVGDTKYNPIYQKRSGWHAIGLYAFRLSFEHPMTGAAMVFHKEPESEPFV